MTEKTKISEESNSRKAEEQQNKFPKVTEGMSDKSVKEATENLQQLMKTRGTPNLLIPQEGNNDAREKSDGLTTEEPELPVTDEQPEEKRSVLDEIKEEHQRHLQEKKLTEIPDMPETWSLEGSIKKVKQVIYTWKKMSAEIMKELWVARDILNNQDRAPDGTFIPKEFTWTKYCEELGHTRQVVNRWLRAWFNPEGEKSTTIDEKYVTKEMACPMSQRKFKIVCKEIENGDGIKYKHIVKYLDTDRYNAHGDYIKQYSEQPESENEG